MMVERATDFTLWRVATCGGGWPRPRQPALIEALEPDGDHTDDGPGVCPGAGGRVDGDVGDGGPDNKGRRGWRPPGRRVVGSFEIGVHNDSVNR